MGMVAAVAAQAVEDAAHAVLADPEGHGPALRVLAALRGGVVELGPGVAGQIGAAGHQAGDLVARALRAVLMEWRVATCSPGVRHTGSFDCQPGRPRPRPDRVPLVAVARPGGQPLLPGVCGPPGRGGWPGGRCRGRRPGTQNVSSGGRPRISLVARTSSSPSGDPWAFGLSVRCGAGQAMWLRRISRLGRSSTAMARRKAGLEGVGVVGHLAEAVDVPAVGLEAQCRRRR